MSKKIILIAGASSGFGGPAEAFTPEQLAELYDVNVLSTQRVNRAVLPGMRQRGASGRTASTSTRRTTAPRRSRRSPTGSAASS